jgi:hypothetical protein
MMKHKVLCSLLVSFFIVFASCQQAGKLENLKQGEAPLSLGTRIENMAIDSEDNLLIAGYSTGNTLPLLVSPQSDQVKKFYSFVSKLGPNGRVKWTTSLGNRRKNFVSAIQTTPTDELFVLYSTLDYDDKVNSEEEEGFFLAKLSSQGKLLSKQKIFDAFTPSLHQDQIAFDLPNEKLYLVIPSSVLRDKNISLSSQDFEEKKYHEISSKEHALVCFSFAGKVQWVVSLNETRPQIHLSETQERIYTLSSVYNPRFPVKDAYQETFGGEGDMYISCWSNTGKLHWASFYGAHGDEHGLSLCTDSQDNLYLLGASNSTSLPEARANRVFPNSLLQVILISFSKEGTFRHMERFPVRDQFFQGTSWGMAYHPLTQKLLICSTLGPSFSTSLSYHSNVNNPHVLNNKHLSDSPWNDIYLMSYDCINNSIDWDGICFGKTNEERILMLGTKDIKVDTKGNIYLGGFMVQSLTKAEPLPSDFFSTLPSPALTSGDINPAFYIKVSPQGKIEAFSFFGNETRYYAKILSWFWR